MISESRVLLSVRNLLFKEEWSYINKVDRIRNGTSNLFGRSKNQEKRIHKVWSQSCFKKITAKKKNNKVTAVVSGYMEYMKF